ncbi:MAG TPA: DMT family transporter [candidate division Zixibacteria bacterium]|nr:DMT family transporter [candidate division Zixibacteria bacterium]
MLLGGAPGVAIIASTIYLVARIGTAKTLTAIVGGQLTLAVVVDHFGLLSVPRVGVTLLRVAGTALVAVGAYFMVRLRTRLRFQLMCLLFSWLRFMQ